MAYTELYCDASTGSNLNGGSDAGAVTYTSTNGQWDGSGTYIPTDGSNPATQGVTVGQFASVYTGTPTVAVYIARVITVTNAANGLIGLSTTSKAGLVPGAQGSGMTIKVGGAWKGPNAGSGFPLTLATFGSLSNSNGDVTRLNLKNNATYSISSSITANLTSYVVQGYSSSAGDGGRAIIDGSSNAIVLLNLGGFGSFQMWADIEFKSSATSGTNALVSAGGSQLWYRCVFHGARGACLTTVGAATKFIENEFYDFNKSNTASVGAVTITDNQNGIVFFYNYFHAAASGNADGILIAGISNHSGTLTAIGNVFDTLGGIPIRDNNTGLPNGGTGFLLLHNDFYNATGSAVKFTQAFSAKNLFIFSQNNNFLKGGAWALDIGTSTHVIGILQNDGFGSGTQANASGDVNVDCAQGSDVSGKLSYASNVTPWNAPTTGDFSITLPAAISAGRGAFTETDGTHTGTVGHPDIGAAQASNGTGISTEVSYSFVS